MQKEITPNQNPYDLQIQATELKIKSVQDTKTKNNEKIQKLKKNSKELQESLNMHREAQRFNVTEKYMQDMILLHMLSNMMESYVTMQRENKLRSVDNKVDETTAHIETMDNEIKELGDSIKGIKENSNVSEKSISAYKSFRKNFVAAKVCDMVADDITKPDKTREQFRNLKEKCVDFLHKNAQSIVIPNEDGTTMEFNDKDEFISFMKENGIEEQYGDSSYRKDLVLNPVINKIIDAADLDNAENVIDELAEQFEFTQLDASGATAKTEQFMENLRKEEALQKSSNLKLAGQQ